ncbi:MAG: FecR domain-containing protein, partial [Actinobacteria bacterium]|nr:FecR domain-containing protein [Actinomycetota bacterium]
MRILLSLMDPITPTAAVAAALLFAGVPAASWADAVGHVATLAGSAEVTGADGARSLQCGDPVFPGDTVETAEGSEIGILMGDTLAHVSAGSSLRVEDAEALELTKGRVRVLDAIDGEDRRSVRALDSVAAHRGNDTEVYIFDEKTGPYAMLCEWDAPLEVQRGEETSVAPPGSCLIAKRDEPLYPADAHPERISVGDSPCGAPIAFGPVA